ncbi:MAG: carbonic anhydrase family protein [Lutibacter sp.]|jgi:carbonic anhydrase|uniref:carbonic anhydrase family protein n=1 Tax=Lutibacter sp. TaxID=1925666 RepID=UPI00299E53AE|nr:carbonic anhydrase family protein [Lutibacter sp.]MDX1828337.1 carbonic anhydrase family protein [Lutibacter sp.]
MRTLTKELQANITPKDAHKILVEGNNRFIQNLKANRNLKAQVLATSEGQFPFAVILSCIDSRVPAELVFDQGIGDVFSVRVAGNVINEDVLGSMEYACKVAGSKIVVVMGHSNCGAVTAACNHYELGNITPLLSKIKPSVLEVSKGKEKLSSAEIEEVSHLNVTHAIERIREESPILAELETKGAIEIVGAMYSVETGKVTFLNN